MTRTALVLAIVCAPALIGAQKPSAAAQIAAAIEEELKLARVPGAGIAVVAGPDIASHGYGVASAASRSPVDAHTAVHLGSLTKLFTALAVIKMLDSRGLSPDAEIGPYLKGLTPRAGAATFHQLLSQSSGLRDREGEDGTSDEAALGEAARALNSADFILPAGVVFSYSNLGYALAGAALEGLAKQPYADTMRDSVFAPLGMTNATLRLSETSGGHAVGHRLKGDELTVVTPIANDTRIWPAGYMWASAADMSRALFALMHQGRTSEGKEALPARTVARVLAPQVPMPNVFVGGSYGYGVMITRDRGVLIYEHGGTLPGFSSILRFAPEREFGIAILTNIDNAPLRRIAQSVMAQSLRLPAQMATLRSDTPVTADEMKPFLGRYRNRGTAQLDVRDGRVVFVLDDGPAMAVSRIGENRYLARPAANVAGPEFVLQPQTRAAPAFLHFALWAYVREN